MEILELGLLVCTTVILIYVLFCLYMEWTKGVCLDITKLTGKTVIITGADKGIGYETALELSRRNARVVMACRDLTSAHAAADRIKKQTQNLNIEVRKVDVSCLSSVRAFARETLERERRIDILINNAGMSSGGTVTKTSEGFELVLATNYLGPFLLTHLLLDRIKQSAPSRIINVSSVTHKFLGQVNLEDLNGDQGHPTMTSYSHSKLALIHFTRELARRLEGTGVTVNSLHPGTVETNFFTKLPAYLRWTFFNPLFRRLLFKSAVDGAQTSIFLSVSPDVRDVTGEYFSDCKIAKPSATALDDGVAKKLYEITERMTGLVN